MKPFSILAVCLFFAAVVTTPAQLSVNQLAGFGAGGDPILGHWIGRVNAAGGTFGTSSIATARTLLQQLRKKTYFAKIVYLLPLLGSNLAAARVPLIDKLNVGIAGNTAFVNGDFSESTGLKGDGTSKILDLLIYPSQLGASNNGGLGYWERAIDFTGSSVEPIGCYNTALSNRFVIDLRSTLAAFRWGVASNGASTASTAANGDYYGQRSSATSREIFKDGSSIATNTTSDATVGAGNVTMRLMGSNEGGAGTYYWKGTCSVAYLTDGTLTSTEVSDLHSTLSTYLITPTGR